MDHSDVCDKSPADPRPPQASEADPGPARPHGLRVAMEGLNSVPGASQRSAELSTRRPTLEGVDGRECGEQRERPKLGLPAPEGALTPTPQAFPLPRLPAPLPTCCNGPQPSQPHPHPRPLPRTHDLSTPVTGLGLYDVTARSPYDDTLWGEGRERVLGLGTLPQPPWNQQGRGWDPQSPPPLGCTVAAPECGNGRGLVGLRTPYL